MQIFEIEHIVVSDDLDELHHVNNVRYVQWVQDVAKAHWHHYATADILSNYYWVMLSHHLEYKQPAILNDNLTLKTFVIKLEGVTSIRKVEIYNKISNTLLVSSETKWCLINAKTNRPARISDEIANLFE
jgi:acyl-CoA thioester hydrolase